MSDLENVLQNASAPSVAERLAQARRNAAKRGERAAVLRTAASMPPPVQHPVIRRPEREEAPREQPEEDREVGMIGGAWAGAVDFVTETTIAARDLANWALAGDETIALIDAAFDPEKDFGQALAEREAVNVEFAEDLRRGADDLAPDATTTPGAIVQGIVQFTAGFIPAAGQVRKVQFLKNSLANRIAQDAVAGAAVVGASFNPDDPNLANFVEEKVPALSTPLSELLATQPGDNAALNRFRSAVTDLIAGPLADLGLTALGRTGKWIVDGATLKADAMRSARAARKFEKAYAEARTPEGQKHRDLLDEALEDPDVTAARTDIVRDAADTPPAGRPAREAAEAEGLQTQAVDRVQAIRDAIKAKPGQYKELVEKIAQGDFDDVAEMTGLNETKFAFDGIEDGDDIRNILRAFEETYADALKTSPDTRVPQEVTAKWAKSLGFTPADVRRLRNTVTDDYGLSAKMYASYTVLLNSARRVKAAAKAHQASGGKETLTTYVEAVNLHAAIMAEVKDIQAELARSVTMMKRVREAGSFAAQEIDELVRETGLGRHLNAHTKAILSGNLTAVNAAAKKATRTGIMDVIAEIAISGMLSNPATHVLNISSNAVKLGLGSAERWIAAGFTGFDKAAVAEARAFTAALGQNAMDALKLAARAARDGLPQVDAKQRIEFDTRRAIRADAVGHITGGVLKVNPGSPLGKAIDLTGSVVRLPGRALITADEFFKVMNIRAQRAALATREAHRQADVRGLAGAERDKFIAKLQRSLQENPTPDIEEAAVDFARYNTFQEDPMTQTGRRMESALASQPLIKLILAPFIRTPLNIMRQGLVDYTPLAYRAPWIKDAMAKGEMEKQIAHARMALGSASLLAGLFVISSDPNDEDAWIRVTGSVDFNSSGVLSGVKQGMLMIGKGPDPITISIDRFDPFSMWLMMAADVQKYWREAYDPYDPQSERDLMTITQAAIGAFTKNVLNNTWLQSVDDFMTFVGTVSDESVSEATRKRALDKYLADQFQKTVPFGAALRGAATVSDNESKEAWSFYNRLKAQVPFFSQEVPPKRDYLGRIVQRSRGDGLSHLWNPFAASPLSDSKLDRELASLSFSIDPLPRSLAQGKVQLNEEQYSEWKRLIGQERYGGMNLEEQLERLIETPQWQTYGKELKAKIVHDLWLGYKAAATERLKQQYPELLQKELEAIRQENLRILAPPAAE